METATSTWCRFLKGIVTAPNVPFACVNNSAEGGTLIDYAMHCAELQPYIEIEGLMYFPFKPRVVTIQATIQKYVQPDVAHVLDSPNEISQRFGPRNFMDDWWYHWSKADGVTFQTTAPYSANASKEASDPYAKFAYAAESHLLETFPDDTPGHFGRASDIFFKKVAATLQNETGRIFIQPKVSFWEHLGGRLRLMKGLLKNGNSNLSIFDEACQALDRMQAEVATNWPSGQKGTPADVIGKIHAFLTKPSITSAAELIHLTNGVLAGAVAQQGKQTSKQYKEVLLNFLSGSAAGGHALLKKYEKDRCTDYQGQDMATQAK